MQRTMPAWLLWCTIALSASTTAANVAMNVEGGKLDVCSFDPLTGYHRSGFCNTDANDHGTHTVCAQVKHAPQLLCTTCHLPKRRSPRNFSTLPVHMATTSARHAQSTASQACTHLAFHTRNSMYSHTPRLPCTGLKPSDRWCLCALRWTQALKAGVAPPVVTEATHIKTLEYVDKVTLDKHALHRTA